LDWIKPQPLRSGDLIGVCAPAGPVDAARLERGSAELRRLGFEVKGGLGLLERRGFTAGSIERRLDELYECFEDDRVKGIFCARGGAGVVQLLERLDVSRLIAHPKLFVGYSDLTFLHALLNNSGLVTLHGPMAARELGEAAYHRESLSTALTGQGAPYATEPDELLTLRSGSASGRLRGGCLSVLAASCGTPWALRGDAAEGVILLLEDVDEPPYKIDRMLRQLRAAGAFEHVRGVVLGDFPGCSPPLESSFSLEEVILEALDGLALPIALGLSTGHTPHPNVTVPLGVRARLECSAASAEFRILEPAVA
jgi:muramoyltetrapeptide carboxypeptidase